MAIHTNINGTEKSVAQPHINIGGVWKEVDSEHVNINGAWKPVFESKVTYTINIYRYGSLYQTLTCAEGDSIKLPSLGSGFATSSSSTTVSYSSGASITPTKNMNLYAVFTYTVKLYKYGTLYSTLTAKSQNSTAFFRLPSASVDSGDAAFYGWAKSSGSTTKSYNGDTPYYISSCSLYAVFSYYECTYTTKYDVVNSSITMPVAGDVTFRIGGSFSGSSDGHSYTITDPLNFQQAFASFEDKWNIKFYSGNTEVSYAINYSQTDLRIATVNYLPENINIVISTTTFNFSSANGSFNFDVTYPTSSTVKYRSTK